MVHVVLNFVLPLTVGWPAPLDPVDHQFQRWAPEMLLSGHPERMYDSGFLYLPGASYLFFPFVLTSFDVSLVFLFVAQVAAFFYVLITFARLTDRLDNPRLEYLLVLLFASGVYWGYNYRVSNFKVLVLFFVVLAVRGELLGDDRERGGGADERHGSEVEVGKGGRGVKGVGGFDRAEAGSIFCQVVATSLIVYLLPLLAYKVLKDFSWKKLAFASAAFVAWNSAFFLPGVLSGFVGVMTNNLMDPGWYTQYELAGHGLFLYLKYLWNVPVWTFLGLGVLLGSVPVFLWQGETSAKFTLFYHLLVLAFYTHVEWQHFAFLVPPLFFLLVAYWPMPTLSDKSVPGLAKLDDQHLVATLREVVPLLCLAGLSFPIPSSVLAAMGVPEVLQPWKRLTFVVLFFAFTAARLLGDWNFRRPFSLRALLSLPSAREVGPE